METDFVICGKVARLPKLVVLVRVVFGRFLESHKAPYNIKSSQQTLENQKLIILQQMQTS